MVQHLKSGNKGEVWWEQRKTCTAGLIAEHMYATAEGQVNLKSTDISIRLKDTSPPDNTWAGAAGYSSYTCDNQPCTKEFTCRVITSQLEFES